MGAMVDRGAVWAATGLGIGLVSPAPGTIGGLWGLPLAILIGHLPSTSQQVVAIAALGLLSAVVCDVAAQALGGSGDPQAIVLDEVVALPVVFLGIGERNAMVWLAGWLLFRLFDIAKPPPVGHAERLPGGWGIVADDLVAAGFACASLHGLCWLDQTFAWHVLSSPA